MRRFLMAVLAITLVLGAGVLVTPAIADEPSSATLRDGESRVKVNGIEHWCRVVGADHNTTPIVVIHGGPGGFVYSFERTIGPKLEAFATVIYYEQRGCGRSEQPANPNAYSIPILVSDLDAIRRNFGLERILLLGFSFGGELALEYSLAHPQNVERLIVQAPTVDGAGLLTDNERLAMVQLSGFRAVAQGEMAAAIREIQKEDAPAGARLEKVWNTVDTDTVDRLLFHEPENAKRNRKLWRESGLVNTGDMFKALAKQPKRDSLFDRLQAVEAPTLIMVGLHDRNVGLELCRDVALLIRQAQLVVFENSAHFPEIEEPAKYAQTVRHFVSPSDTDDH